MWIKNKNVKNKQRGQGMTEYLIIVALIAVAAIGVYRLFGDTIRAQTASMAMELGGNDGSAANTAASGYANEAASAGTTQRSLDNFASNGSNGN